MIVRRTPFKNLSSRDGLLKKFFSATFPDMSTIRRRDNEGLEMMWSDN